MVASKEAKPPVYEGSGLKLINPLNLTEATGVSTKSHHVHVKPRELKFRPDGFPDLLDHTDREFWGDYPPSFILITSGSYRKTLMLLLLHHGFTFPAMTERQQKLNQDRVHAKRRKSKSRYVPENRVAAESPAEYSQYISRYIANGNGERKQGMQLLGYLHGVPILSAPQIGETDKNDDPVREANNKIWFWKEVLEGQNGILISTDTVDGPDSTFEKLGKPANRIDYPRANSLDEEEYTKVLEHYQYWFFDIRQEHAADYLLAMPRLGGFRDEAELKAAREAYLRLYLARFYPPGTEIVHTNGLAIYDTLVSGRVLKDTHLDFFADTESGRVWGDWQITQMFFEILRSHTLKPDPESGGGGISQQTVDFEQGKIYEELLAWAATLDPENLGLAQSLVQAAETGLTVSYDYYMTLGDTIAQEAWKDLSLNQLRWAVYCQIAGMPWAVFVNALEHLKYSAQRAEVVEQLKQEAKLRRRASREMRRRPRPAVVSERIVRADLTPTQLQPLPVIPKRPRSGEVSTAAASLAAVGD